MNPWDNDPEAVTAIAPWEADPEAGTAPWDNDPPTDPAELETFRRDNRLADASTIALQDPRALEPGLQLAQEPLPALQPPDIQTPPANINAVDSAQMVSDLYRLERDAQQAEGAGIQPANEAANMQRRNLMAAGMEPEDIDRRLADFRSLDFSMATRGMPRARTLSDGRLVVDPQLAFDPAAWDAAVDGSNASDVEKTNAKDYRAALREELAAQIISPLRSASPEFAASLEAGRGTRTPGELVEEFKRKNSGAFSNLWDQVGIALSQGKAQLGKSLMGAARMATFDTLPGNLGEGFADDAQWHAQRRAALGGGQWAGDLTSTIVGTLPAVGVGMGTGSFPAMLATAGGQTAGDTFVTARQAGWSPLEAAGAALTQGGIEAGITAAFGKTGIESVTAGASSQGLVRRVVTQGAKEVPEEVTIEALHAPVNEMIEPGTFAQLPERLKATAWQSFAIGGGVAALNGKPSEPKPQTATAAATAETSAPAEPSLDMDALRAEIKAIAFEDGGDVGGEAPAPKEPTIWKPAEPEPQAPPAAVAPDEAFARATSFPRGLLPFVTPEEAGEVMATKQGQMQLVAVQGLMRRASERKAAADAAAAPAATQDGPAQPAPAGQSPIGPDVQAAIDADPVTETDGATESASPQSATPFAERQQDPVAEGALHQREVDLLRRLDSKRRETRENAQAELMTRNGLPWTNKPEQAEINARYTEELRARVAEREARWTNEADQLAEDAGIEVTADNIPFSQNKIAPEPIAQAVRETMELLGVGPDVVTTEVVADAEEIADATERTAVMSSKKAGNNVRAYYMAARDGKPARVVVNAAGVRTPEEARIAVLHEVAGHHGLRVLFTKAQGKWRGIVDRLYNRLSNGELSQDVQRETGVRTLRELQELYHRPAVGMNYDPTTVEGRSNLIEEVLATMAPFAKKPAWYQSILSELKTLLNRITGGMLGRSFTDADVNVLLAKARKAARKTAKTGRVSGDAAKLSQGDAYSTAPDTLMGFRRNGPSTAWNEQKYKYVQPVRVTWSDGQTIEDAQRGLNQAHAMERARRNWPGATIEALERITLDGGEVLTQGIAKNEDIRFSQERAERDARSVERALVERDADYMAAVERGDMAAAQRMVDAAAKEAGYNVGPVYHGTPNGGFTTFTTQKTTFQKKGNTSDPNTFLGAHFAEEKSVAERFLNELYGAKDGAKNPQLYGVFLKIKNPLGGDAIARGDVAKTKQLAEKASEDLRAARQNRDALLEQVRAAGIEGDISLIESQGVSAWVASKEAAERAAFPDVWRKIERLDAEIERLRSVGYLPSIKIPNGKTIFFNGDRGLVSEGEFGIDALSDVGTGRNPNAEKDEREDRRWRTEIGRSMRKNFDALGYDAIIYENTGEGGTAIIIPSPNQIKSADPVTRDDAGNIIPLSQRFNTASNDIRFSQERAERDARSVERALVASAEELKEFATQKKAKADEKVPDAVKQTLNGVYAIYTDAQALADAEAWINKDGADAVERTIMGDNRAQLDGRDVAAAKIILQRHSAMGLNTRYTDLLRSVMGKMNTQAQGLQKMHLLFDTTTPEGALAHFQREVEKVVEQLSDKNKEQAKIIQGLLGMLEQFKADAATSRIVMALRTIATSADLTPARKAEIQDKMRNALVNDDGTDTTRVRLRGLFIAAGVDVKAADKMAVQLLAKFRAAQKKVRAQVIKAMLKVPKIAKRIPKGQFAKWEKLNEEGVLSDAKMFAAIAKKFGFPVFTSEDAATIRGFFDKYKAATEPEMKFVQGAKLLEWVESRTNPAGLMEKASSLYKLTKLASFKTIERNFLGNLTFALARTAGIDVPLWIGEKGLSLFTGKRVSPLKTAIGNMFRGQAEVNRLYRIGRDYAVSQGEGGTKAVRAGFDALLTAARYHMSGYRDASSLKNIHRSVFTSAAGRMFEKVMHAAITLPDFGRFYGEVNAELARLMDAAGPGVVMPTAEMYEAAYTHAMRELYQGKNKLTEATEGIVKGLNKLTGSEKFGLGTVIAPFVRVPVNILKEGATWSPLGVVRAIYNAKVNNDPRRAVQNMMKAVVGTGALIPSGAWLYGLGIITAAFDEDPEIAAVQRASGQQKYAVNLSMLRRRMMTGNWHTKEQAQDGDMMVSYAWAQPMAFSLAAGAEMQRRHDMGKVTDEPWWVRNITQPAGAGMGAFLEQPLVTGLSAFSMDLMQARQTGNLEPLMRVPIRALDFVPSIVRDVRFYNDNAVAETRSSDVIAGEFSRIMGGIPFMDLPQRYNVLGEAEERYQAASNTLLNTFFNPAMTTFVRKHPVASEVLRLADATGDNSAAPARVSKSIRINTTGLPDRAQTLEMTNQDISRLQGLQGKLFVELAKLEMTRPDYFGMTDNERARSMADAVAASQAAAKSVLFGHRLWSITSQGVQLNRDAVRAVMVGKATGVIP